MLPESERYLTRNQLAEMLQVSPQTVRKWEQEGMPFAAWGPRLKRYRLREIGPWRAAREEAGWR